MHACIFAMRHEGGAQVDGAGFVVRDLSSGNECGILAYNPLGTAVHAVFVAIYYEDETDFTTPPSGTNPTWVTRFDLESSVGQGCTFAMCSGDNDGAQILQTQWPSSSVEDDFSSGIVFGLVPAPPAQGGSGPVFVDYPNDGTPGIASGGSGPASVRYPS
jgi:hypothetical protein